MKTSSRNSKKNLLALALSFVMVASGASAFAACDNGKGNDDTSSDSSASKPSTTVNSDLKITNSDFETFNTSSGSTTTVIGTSSSTAPGWNRTTTAPSGYASTAASGIVDLSKWDELTTSKKDVSNLTVEEAKALFKEKDALTIKDKLDYYEAWKEANPKEDDKIATKLKDFYEAFNINSKDLPVDSDDNPLANPYTHDYDATKGEFGKHTNVLMIHNQYPAVKPGKATGTAQKYASSTTVTVEAGTAATFSVWVKTMDLKIADTEGQLQPAVDAGAYISVSHSVGSKSLPALTIKNINTENETLTDTNGWKKYSFYLKGSAYADTTFSITLGLGMGNTNRMEYVNGYAFFDDIECQTVSYEKYDAVAPTTPDAIVDFNSDEEEKTFDAGSVAFDSFAINLYYGLTSSAILDGIAPNDTVATSTTRQDGTVVTSMKPNVDTDNDGINDKVDLDGDGVADAILYAPLKNGFDPSNDVHEVFNGAAALQNSSNAYVQEIFNRYFSEKDDQGNVIVDDFAENEKILMLMSADGVSYTLDTDYKFNFTFQDENNNDYLADYLAISFFVKTSDMTNGTGAGVTLKDGYNKHSFSAIDTTNTSPLKVDLNVNDEADEDVHDGWQQYFFFVENGYETKANGEFTLSFSFGPTNIADTSMTSYREGFAAFTKFEVYPMSKAEYESVSAGSYAQVVSVTGSTEEVAKGNSGFDSAAKVPSNALDKGFATPMNYDGVYSNNQLVNQNGTHDNRNNNPYAGLLNKDSFAKYFSAPTGSATLLIEKLKAVTGESSAETVWNTMFGYYNFKDENGNPISLGSRTQPLFIWNTETDDNKADANGILQYGYGFIGDSISVSANNYKKVSLAVKVGAQNATAAANTFANIYLVDMSDKTYSSTLSIGRNLTYWYDDNGNICADEKCEKVAFRLQDNGLYTIDTEWNEYKKLSETEREKYSGYFANLAAYAEDKDGNLVVAEGGASHDYNSHWNNEGLDGIAFYAKKTTVNGQTVTTYYADKACTILVNNLLDVTKTATNTTAILEARYLAEENRQLMYTVGDTNGEWVNVSFYIHTGAEAKNYRLEVWSGERPTAANPNGKGNPVDSYVVFDMNYAGDASTQFPEFITKYENNKDKYSNADAFESVFSWYDSDGYLRYNKDIDDNRYGNLYAESYTYSKNTSGVAYLKYQEGNEVRIFADYVYEDVTVTPASRDDGNDDVSTPDEEPAATDETNFFMLFSSISIAAVLVFVIAAVAVRKIMKKFGKSFKNPFASWLKKGKKEKKVKEEKAAKPEAPKAKKEVDEDSPYND